MAHAPIDLSFARYVAARKGDVAARAREAAAYAYGADRRLRERLTRLRPVTLALEGAARWMRSEGKKRALEGAVRVGPDRFPAVAAAIAAAAERLALRTPDAYVTPEPAGLEPLVLGGVDEAVVLVPSRLVDVLDAPELLACAGAACGRIQNDHVQYLTVLWALESGESLVARWAGRPAQVALAAWNERAIVTADRAALLVSRDRAAAAGWVVKSELGARQLVAEVDVPSALAEIRSGGELSPRVARSRAPFRVRALELFAETTYARATLGEPEGQGTTLEACDAEVGRLQPSLLAGRIV